ncbi:LytR family transcriptional regulator [Synechococcus sp. RSCCF101]|uniref:LCP family protein n=1 Tax=Synechococcus sp. RSCCF101 TaxID=2511069 RepID=UPI001245F6AF|nr:LCP family protein [Synechococcus sp. RSCCF101]QEY31153.1 LytR family transcriptional regulator [Synechococcus sp. RSCCF101]
MRVAVPLAIAAGLAGGLALARPLISLLSEAPLAAPEQGRPNLTAAINPFRNWMGQTGEVFLVLGTDASGTNTDVIVALQVNDGVTRAFQIPRDSYIESWGYGALKVNALYAYGGTEAVKSELSHLLGVTIDHHIVVDLDGIRSLSDLIGGVEVDVPKRLYYVDNSQDLLIDLQPGPQVLRGRDLEGFLRWRHDEEGDLGRLDRQQLVLHALVKKLTSPEIVLRLPVLLGAASQNIRTDLGPMELGGLITRIGTTELEAERLDARPFMLNNISYLETYWPDLSRWEPREREDDAFVF